MPSRVTHPKKGLTCLSVSGVPVDVYEEFKTKVQHEGYTIQEAIYLLMKAYIEDRIQIG